MMDNNPGAWSDLVKFRFVSPIILNELKKCQAVSHQCTIEHLVLSSHFPNLREETDIWGLGKAAASGTQCMFVAC